MTRQAFVVVSLMFLATAVRAAEPYGQLTGRVVLSERALPDAGAPAAAYLEQHVNTLRAGPDGVWRGNYAAFLSELPTGTSGRLVLTVQDNATEREVWAAELVLNRTRVVSGSFSVGAPTVVANKKHKLAVSVQGKVLALTSVTLQGAPSPELKLISPPPNPSLQGVGVKQR